MTGDHEFYDFEAKYLPEEHTRLDIPADLPDGDDRADQGASPRARSRRVSCEGLARVDFFLLPDGSLVINELNTMPGFTPPSMYPQMWAASGVDYPALVDRLIQLALRRGTGLRSPDAGLDELGVLLHRLGEGGHRGRGAFGPLVGRDLERDDRAVADCHQRGVHGVVLECRRLDVPADAVDLLALRGRADLGRLDRRRSSRSPGHPTPRRGRRSA